MKASKVDLVVLIEGGILSGEGLPRRRRTVSGIGIWFGTFPNILSALLEMFSLSARPVAPPFSSSAAHFPLFLSSLALMLCPPCRYAYAHCLCLEASCFSRGYFFCDTHTPALACYCFASYDYELHFQLWAATKRSMWALYTNCILQPSPLNDNPTFAVSGSPQIESNWTLIVQRPVL